jgi:hypothetical protein
MSASSETLAWRLRSVNPERSKAVSGSDEDKAGPFPNAVFGPGMPVGERAATRVTWNHFYF